MTKIIYLDPGHGGNDPGAVLGDRYEKNDNLRIAKAVREELKRQGHVVLMSREGDDNPALEARIGAAAAAKADLFLSLHRNSFPDPSAKGIEVWVRYPNHSPAACEVLEELAKLPHQANRGVKQGAYKVLCNAPMPAMLLELGFLSNAEDNSLFDRHFHDYAAAIARGALAALGVEWGTPAKPLYRVQVGAFENREYAEAFLFYLTQEKGVPAFLVSL